MRTPSAKNRARGTAAAPDAPRERPILFSAPMVRAILNTRADGTAIDPARPTKTMTRRPMKRGQVWSFCKEPCDLNADERRRINAEPFRWERDNPAHPTMDELLSICPYGKPGDRLWVRETWGLLDTEPSDGPERAKVFYRAQDGYHYDLRYQLWRPSIHMPRWASRLTLEIVSVRVELVQDISTDDIFAEGTWIPHADDGRVIQRPGHSHEETIAAHFAEFWDSINAGRGFGWDKNPWVWVVEFRRVEPGSENRMGLERGDKPVTTALSEGGAA